jgi:hypothetical protein
MTLASEVALGGRYRLLDRIAVGGMGEVWRASDDLLHRTVAVKVLKQEYVAEPGFVARFQDEARHVAGLSHPGIAAVYDYGEFDGTPYIVMELVPGEPLSAMLARAGRLPVDTALDIAAQTATALHAAHTAGVVHRDVKPGNILVTSDGAVKVTDFGIARATDAVPITRTGMMLGTVEYVSPEQAAGEPVTAASDVYSLGVVLYECLAGHRPFAAASPVAVALAHLHSEPAALPDDVPPAVRQAVATALAKSPADRFPTAAAFAVALSTARSGEAPAGDPRTGEARSGEASDPTLVLPAVARLDPVRRPARGWWWAAGLLALALVALVVVSQACVRSETRRVAVPDALVGKPADQAAAALTGKGFQVRRRNAPASAAAGTVVQVDPRSGTLLPAGSTVTLVVSAGSEQQATPTPTSRVTTPAAGTGKGDKNKPKGKRRR